MRKIIQTTFVLMIVLLCNNSAQAIPKEIKAKSEYILAQDMFQSKDYRGAVEHLNNAKILLNRTNSKIQYMLVKSYTAQKSYKKAKNELELYFAVIQKSDSSTDQYNEMVVLVSRIEEGIKAEELAERKALENQKEKEREKKEAQRQAKLAGERKEAERRQRINQNLITSKQLYEEGVGFGSRVTGIIYNSQAQSIGLRVGDIIMIYNDFTISDVYGQIRRIKETTNKASVDMFIIRDNNPMHFVAKGGFLGVHIENVPSKVPLRSGGGAATCFISTAIE